MMAYRPLERFNDLQFAVFFAVSWCGYACDLTAGDSRCPRKGILNAAVCVQILQNFAT